MWKNSQETEAVGILGPIKRSKGSRERGGCSLNAGFATRCVVLQDAEFLSAPEDRVGMEKKAVEATRKKKKLKMYDQAGHFKEIPQIPTFRDREQSLSFSSQWGQKQWVTTCSIAHCLLRW